MIVASLTEQREGVKKKPYSVLVALFAIYEQIWTSVVSSELCYVLIGGKYCERN